MLAIILGITAGAVAIGYYSYGAVVFLPLASALGGNGYVAFVIKYQYNHAFLTFSQALCQVLSFGKKNSLHCRFFMVELYRYYNSHS